MNKKVQKNARLDATETEYDLASTIAENTKDAPFDGFVIALGASAGGLEALERFFKHCPANTGAAFVVIQHLSPDHKSMMHELITRYTQMTVKVVADEMPIERNHIYLIPPGTIMRITANRFSLSPKNPRQLTLPIDIFLKSLAETQTHRAIAVILSGTGSDGTRGSVAINAAGGLLLAQTPEDAKFDGMPASVIGTGLVDDILPAVDLGQRIVSHINNVSLAPKNLEILAGAALLSTDEALESILQLLFQVGGIDFRDYKPATVLRRIQRRMQVRHLRRLGEYYALLDQERTELTTLRREMLIPVTSFFRDTDAFHALRSTTIHTLVTTAQTSDHLRVWVAGCSTGEEAYSIAMLFMEACEEAKRWPALKIFATDVNQSNVDFASAGQYPESAAAELTPERLERFFNRNGSTYTVKQELRQNIVFARHNVLTDPPFTRMHLVSCRNLLIYFNPDAQARALNRLQYAVKPQGYLFLGSSESLASNSTGFDVLQSKYKIFKRTGNLAAATFNDEASTRNRYAPSRHDKSQPSTNKLFNEGDFVDEAMQILLDDFAPPSMLVNEKHEIIHMFGDITPFLKVRSGTASLILNRVLPEHLLPIASALLFKASKQGERMVSEPLRLSRHTEETVAIRLIVNPVKPRQQEKLYLLSFEHDHAASRHAQPSEAINIDAETFARLEMLERELSATRESLQSTIEELETSNEELQATNEELMASNEELQSSNEELQSVNEELNTINAEFQEKMSILNQVNADLDSMFKASGVATIFVDEEIKLTRYSPDAAIIFKLRETDIGRPLDEIAHVLKYPSLIEDMHKTLRTPRMLEREARGPDGKMYLVRILPYAIASSKRKGVVSTFVDITAFHDHQRLQNILNALPEHVAVLEHDGSIAMVNEAWIRFAQENGDKALTHSGVGCNYLDACRTGIEYTDHMQASQAILGIKNVLNGNASGFSLQYPCHSPSEQRWFVMNVAPIRGHQFGAVVSHFNISACLNQQEAPLEGHTDAE